MKAALRLGASAAVVALGATGFLAHRGEAGAARVTTPEHPSEPVELPLPSIALKDSTASAIDRIDITQPDWGGGDRPPAVKLERTRGEWEMTAASLPHPTHASASKVEAMIANLAGLAIDRALDRSAGAYDAFHVSGERAVHVVALSGGRPVSNLYFGRSDVGGQAVRIDGVDGVFVTPNAGPRGYEGFLYTRDVRAWRETSIFGFDEDSAIAVDVINGHGRFSFAKGRDGWSGTLARRRKDGTLAPASARWSAFDPGQVAALLRAYKTLSAEDFGDDVPSAESGLDDPERAGGTVRIRLEDGEERAMSVGKVTTRASRWTVKGGRWAVEPGGDGTVVLLAPSSADWATADASAFEMRPARPAPHVK